MSGGIAGRTEASGVALAIVTSAFSAMLLAGALILAAWHLRARGRAHSRTDGAGSARARGATEREDAAV